MLPPPSHFLDILRDQPNNAQAWLGLAMAYRQQQDATRCTAAAQRAVEIEPENVDALHQFGWSLLDVGLVRESLQIAERAVALAPHDARLKWLRAFSLLQLGDYPRGWEDYEARWQIKELNLAPPPFKEPQWHGEPLAGKTIYLYPEQGLGDSLQFVRYVPLIRNRDAGKILLATPPELVTLFDRSFPDVHLVRSGEPIPKFDVHCPLLSLPHAFATTVETVPATVPYVHADSGKVVVWRRRLAEHPGIKIGLAWAGAAKHPADRARSMQLSALTPLAAVPGVRFVSLQKGEPALQVAQTPALNLLDWTSELQDFSDTAALVIGLDLVITVCTAVAHLAGGLGVPTWTMRPFAADFRWLLDRADTPWYPTMRLFLQPSLGDWESVISEIKTAVLRRQQ